MYSLDYSFDFEKDFDVKLTRFILDNNPLTVHYEVFEGSLTYNRYFGSIILLCYHLEYALFED